MSSFIKSIKAEIVFDNETISVTLAPIKYKDTLRFNSLPVVEDDAGNKTIQQAQVTELMQEVVPLYVTSIKGLTDAEGAELGIADIIGVSYFVGLVNEIGTHLVIAGTPPNPRRPVEQ